LCGRTQAQCWSANWGVAGPAPHRANAGASFHASVRFLRPPMSSRTAGFPRFGWGPWLSPWKPAHKCPALKRWRASARGTRVCFPARQAPGHAEILQVLSAWLPGPCLAATTQGSFAREALLSVTAHTSPCAGPEAPALFSSIALIESVPAACAIHSWSPGPSRFELLFVPGVPRPICRRLIECTRPVLPR
jgi:hypothetical protein